MPIGSCKSVFTSRSSFLHMTPSFITSLIALRLESVFCLKQRACHGCLLNSVSLECLVGCIHRQAHHSTNFQSSNSHSPQVRSVSDQWFSLRSSAASCLCSPDTHHASRHRLLTLFVTIHQLSFAPPPALPFTSTLSSCTIVLSLPLWYLHVVCFFFLYVSILLLFATQAAASYHATPTACTPFTDHFVPPQNRVCLSSRHSYLRDVA